MAKIKKIKDNNGTTIYPLTSVDAVFDKNGKTLTGGGVLTYISTSIPTDLFLNFVTSDNLEGFGTIGGDYGVCCLILNNVSLSNISGSSYGVLMLANTGMNEYTYTLEPFNSNFHYTKVYDKNTIQSLLADNEFETTGWTRN